MAARPQTAHPGARSAFDRNRRIPESDAHSGMPLGVRRAPEARHRGRATACRSDKAGVCVVRWTLTARSLLPSLRHPRPLRPPPPRPASPQRLPERPEGGAPGSALGTGRRALKAGRSGLGDYPFAPASSSSDVLSGSRGGMLHVSSVVRGAIASSVPAARRRSK